MLGCWVLVHGLALSWVALSSPCLVRQCQVGGQLSCVALGDCPSSLSTN